MSTSTDAEHIPSAPVAEQRPHRREHHGDVVDDPYEWLRDKEDPAVVAHLEAENEYAEQRTAHLEPVRTAIFDEIRSRVKETDLSVPVAHGPWWYYTRTVEGSQYAIHCRAPLTDRSDPPRLDDDGEKGDGAVVGEQVLLDGNDAAAGHEFFSVGGLVTSADHHLLAHAIDTEGDERFAVTVTDLRTGEVLDTAVTGVGYGLVFSLDGTHLFYVRVDDAWRPHQVWRHRVGTPTTEDTLVFEETDERFWMGIGTSRDERQLIIAVGSKTTSEAWLLDAADPTGDFHCVAPRREGVEYDVEPAGDRLLIVHNTDTVDGDLAWAPLTCTSHEEWRPLLGSRPGERFLGTEAFDDFAVLQLRRDGLSALRVLPRDDSAAGFGTPVDLTFDDDLHSVGLSDNPESATDRIRLVHESWVSPRAVIEHVVATGERTVLKRQEVLGEVDLGDYVQSREWVTTSDGARVPLSIVRRKDVEPDGSNPVILGGYGAYEISSDPYFSVARLSLLDRGVVHATAHVRGGGEMGRAWYDEGKLLHKRNTFTDFIACAQHLVETGWAAPDRLGAEGGSAGGLLMGAVANLAPERFRVIHGAVPFVDALTTILRPDLPLTVGEWEEWGNPLEDPEVYAYMKGYSPYENVGVHDYPAILATTSLNDTRVFFTEPAKWIARLREVATNDPATHPFVLRTEMVAGHGGRSGRYDAWHQIAWEWAFMLDQLGATDRGDAGGARPQFVAS
ncbi:S9 family peptidase [Janibacter sp. G56]|uniref:S9 family peptidase n=1 Tax=Janibacter sp. G56 TaxID=3418717 RepID=UPI003CFE344B